MVPGGIEYGSIILVEFEPQSCWYDAAYSIAAQALRQEVRTDLHIFQHTPQAVRDRMSGFGLDVKELIDQDLLRIIDSYTVQIGVNAAEVPKGADVFKTSSVKLQDWAQAAAAQISSDIPESEKYRIHIDDNTAVLTRYNEEQAVVDYWRTRIIPLYRARASILVNAVALGVASDSFYKQQESLVDGIMDCRSQEENGRIEHYVRVRAFRGKSPDSRWQHVELQHGEVIFAPERRKHRELAQSEGRQLQGERRLAAIMFTDMVGFTALSQRDETLALKLLEEQRMVVRSRLAKYNGREIDTAGDSFLVEFVSSFEAVRCAIDIQSALRDANAGRPADEQILIRIGIHLGDVIHTGDNIAGDAVNVASRIEPLAAPGGICITAPVHAGVANKLEQTFESLGTPQLKNVATPMEVFRLAGFGQGKGSAPVRSAGGAKQLPKDRIAVLPFINISRDQADEFFSDGMTEELISSVSHIKGLHVIARTSVMRYKGADKPIADIGRELNVGSVLEGSVRKLGDKVRISVQLIETSNEEPHWSEKYDRELSDIFEIQSDIAQKVAEALREHVLSGPPGAPATTTTRNTKSYINYLLGRQHWNRGTEADLKQAVEYFQKSLGNDGNYAKAYAGLADTYAALALLEFMAPNEAFPKAREAVQSALSLDHGLADAHTSLGLIRARYEWDWDGAESAFREAIRINPNSPLTHFYYADLLKALARFDEALAEVDKAQELDPLSLFINTGVGHVLYLSRRYDEAIEQYRKAVELDPNFMATHIWFGRPYLEKGMFAEAIAELEIAVRLSGESTLALAMLGHGLASAGRREEALQILEKLKQRSKGQYVPSYWIAVIYNGLKDREQVIAWMRKAYDERSSWLYWSNVEPRFDWLRSDPDFAALMRAMKFPPPPASPKSTGE